MNKAKTTSTLYFGNITLCALVYIATKNRKRFAFPLLCYFQPELSWSINSVASVTVWYTFKFYFIFFHHSFNSTLLSFSEQISNCIWPWSVAGAENSCRLVVPLSPCLRKSTTPSTSFLPGCSRRNTIVSSIKSYSLACYVMAFVGIRGDKPMPVFLASSDNKLNICVPCGLDVYHLVNYMDVVTKHYKDPVSNVKFNIKLRFFIHRIFFCMTYKVTKTLTKTVILPILFTTSTPLVTLKNYWLLFRWRERGLNSSKSTTVLSYRSTFSRSDLPASVSNGMKSSRWDQWTEKLI